MDIGDCVFGVADRCGGSPFQEGGPESVFQVPGDCNPQLPWDGLLLLLVETQIQEAQIDFRPGPGTLDHLFTFTRTLEGALDFAQPVHMGFVDLEKVYDRIQ